LPALAAALKAPMTSILGYSDLLARGGGLTDDQVERFLQRIDANLARMQVMLSNLMTVLALDGERMALSPEAVDVEQAVQAGVGRAQAQFQEKALVVNFALDAPLPPVSADPGALAQIIDNLLVNAAQRSPQGGDVTVSVATREDLGGRHGMVIAVHDRGAQLSGAGQGVIEIDAGGSESVGLTITRLLAEQQGGRAWAESDPLGTRFHVRLPLRRAA
jgi:signal transduction histidine kinase